MAVHTIQINSDNVVRFKGPTDFALQAAITAPTTADLKVYDPTPTLLATIAMTIYGTPVANESTWGFQGIVPDTQSGLTVGMVVKLEVTFDGGAGLKLIDSISATVTD